MNLRTQKKSATAVVFLHELFQHAMKERATIS